MLHIPAAKMKEADMRSRSERGNRKMDEVQGWRSKQVNYKKKRKGLCAETNEEKELRGRNSSQNTLKSETLLGSRRQKQSESVR